MSDSIIGEAILGILTILLAWAALKVWRSRNLWARWLGGVLVTFFTLIFAALTVFGILGINKLFRTNTVSVPEVTVGSTAEQIARGEHLAVVICAGCHSEDDGLPLTGGENLSADAGMPLGDIYAPNLTPATDLKDWPDADLFRVIRTGVDDEGRATAMTAVVGAQALSDEDTLALIAYLRQAPAVQHETPEFKPSVLMAILAGSGMLPMNIPGAVTPLTAPARGPTVEYGQYVTAFMDCKSCHGQKLDGKVPPPYPPGPNLQADFTGWTKDQFVSEVQNHAAAIKPGEVMPWMDVSHLDALEMEALYLYLHQAVGP
jgi:mono/diheme cytochrome c family protein